VKLLIINGPNLNLLGRREPDVYGAGSYDELTRTIEDFARGADIEVEIIQTNSEGAIIDAVHGAVDTADGIVINPGAYTHYSYAIHDALKSVDIPAVEVHLTNIASREEFRRRSVVAPACVGQISGLGFAGYIAAIGYFKSVRVGAAGKGESRGRRGIPN
jgi:3-dehydroquinate dehydratase-2